MPRNRYQTYVFDNSPDVSPILDPKCRDVLGGKYKEGTPCAWMDGHALREKTKMEDFIRDVRDNGHNYTGEDLADKAEKLFADLRIA